MLSARQYQPGLEDLLFHYCSPHAFHAICSSGNLRLSDVFAMNDFMEMHWGYKMWEEAATRLLPSLGKPFLDDIDRAIQQASASVLPLVSCFSRRGDVLSQWRAYAHDGTGFAIGFNPRLLGLLPAQTLSVEYQQSAQVDEIVRLASALHARELSAPVARGADFRHACTQLTIDLAGMKSPGFAEEDEVRLVHILNLNRTSSGGLHLSDPGGTAFGKPMSPQPIGFTMRGSVPVAHVDLHYRDQGTPHPIAEVVLGPRNDAIPSGVSTFLETIGLTAVRVSRSATSYR